MIACLAGFLMGFVGSMPIAGPTSLLVFHRGMLARYRDGWAIGLGGALVEGMYCSMAVHGFGILHDRFAFFEPLAKGVGILLLLAIGVYLIFSLQEASGDRAVADASTVNWGRQFCIGLSVAACNPTLLITWSGSVAVLYSLSDLTFQGYDRIGFAASVAVGIVTWFSILLGLLRHFRGRFPFYAQQRLMRTVGMALIALSVTSAAWTAYGSIGFSP